LLVDIEDMNLLDKIFGSTDADSRSNGVLISDIAKYGNRRKDIKELYKRLPSLELYAKIIKANITIRDEGKIVVGDEEKIEIESALLSNGMKMVTLFIEKEDPRLLPNFIGMKAREALEMVFKIPDMEGAIIQNEESYWIAIPKREIEIIIRRFFD
jgi:hypothetical protein